MQRATRFEELFASSRLVFAASGLAGHEAFMALAYGSRAALLHGPDGRALLLIEGAWSRSA